MKKSKQIVLKMLFTLITFSTVFLCMKIPSYAATGTAISSSGSTIKIGGETWTTTVVGNNAYYVLEAGDYYLASTISTNRTILVDSGEVTIDLNGYGIEANQAGSVIRVSGGAELTIEDNGDGSRGSLWLPNSQYKNWELSNSDSDIYYRIEGGYITGGTGSSLGTGKNPVTGAASSDSFYVGGGICNLGTLNFIGGNIVGNRVVTNFSGGGGGIFNGGTLMIGPAANVVGNSVISGSNSTQATNAKTDPSGSGVMNANGAVLFTNKGTIKNNYGFSNARSHRFAGAGVASYAPFINTDTGRIIYNTAEGKDNGNTLTNSYSSFGGGVFVGGSSFENNGIISENKAHCGGGVCAWSNSFLKQKGEISNNTASDRGGGIYVYAGSVDLNSGSRINGNHCLNRGISQGGYGTPDTVHGGYGGGIAIITGQVNVYSGAEITGNDSANGGAGIYVSAAISYSRLDLGVLNLQGAVNISGNYLTGSDSVYSDILLCRASSDDPDGSKQSKIGITGPLAAGPSPIRVGIREASSNTVYTPFAGTVTSGYGANAGTASSGCFAADSLYTGQELFLNGQNELAFGTHRWHYEAGTDDDKNKIYAWCENVGGSCEYSAEGDQRCKA